MIRKNTIKNYDELLEYINTLNKIELEEINEISSIVAKIEKKWSWVYKKENAFFHTPYNMARRVYSIVKPEINENSVILEPTCWFGSLLFPILLDKEIRFKKIIWIELSSDLARVAQTIIRKLWYTEDKVTILNKDTLSYAWHNLDIDIIISNPPFWKEVKETEKQIINKILETLRLGLVKKMTIILPVNYLKDYQKVVWPYWYRIDAEASGIDGFDNTQIKVDIYNITFDESLRTISRDSLKKTINIEIEEKWPMLYDINLYEEIVDINKKIKFKKPKVNLQDFISEIPSEVDKLDIYKQWIFYRFSSEEIWIGFSNLFLEFVKKLDKNQTKKIYNICFLELEYTINYLILLKEEEKYLKDDIDNIIKVILQAKVKDNSLFGNNTDAWLLSISEFNFLINEINPFYNKEEVDKLYDYLSIDNGFLKKLKPHQIVGYYKTLRALKSKNWFIIADDVGLGKTFVWASVIMTYLRDNPKKVLLLAPKSVINWRAWIKVFETLGLSKQLTTSRIIIDTLQSIPKYVWNEDIGFIVVDEAHYFRNRKSDKSEKWVYYKSLQSFNLEGNKTPMLLLTATPINNKVMDMVNLVTLFNPSILSEVKTLWLDLIEKWWLNNLLQEYISKFTRDSVIKKYWEDHPAYKWIISKVKPIIKYVNTSEYEKQYSEYVQIIDEIVTNIVNIKNDKTNETKEKWLQFILKLKKLDALPYYYAKTENDWAELKQFLDKNLKDLKDFKIKLLIDIIKKHKGEKFIIFSSYKEVWQLIKEVLQKTFKELNIEYTDWEDTEVRKSRIIRLFAPKANKYTLKEWEKEIDILVATDTLAEWVNLQDAHIWVNFDLPFNPVKIWQRIWRIYRMWINFIPIFYNFVPSTIFDKILALQEKLSTKEQKIQTFFDENLYKQTNGGNKDISYEELKNDLDNTERLLLKGWNIELENLFNKLINSISDFKLKEVPIDGGNIYLFLSGLWALVSEPIIIPIHNWKLMYNVDYTNNKKIFNVNYYKKLENKIDMFNKIDKNTFDKLVEVSYQFLEKNNISFPKSTYLESFNDNYIISTILKILNGNKEYGQIKKMSVLVLF